jgi:hypothetical protein
MQGVVGMLDVMMANVKEAGETLNIDLRTRAMLETLKENIEAVQGTRLVKVLEVGVLLLTPDQTARGVQ